jgi:hypothetical protein
MATVKLQSVDEQEFEVPVEVAKMSETVRHMIEGMFLPGPRQSSTNLL